MSKFIQFSMYIEVDRDLDIGEPLDRPNAETQVADDILHVLRKHHPLSRKSNEPSFSWEIHDGVKVKEIHIKSMWVQKEMSVKIENNPNQITS